MNPTDFDAEILSSQLLEENAILLSKISCALACEENEVPAALGEVLRFLYLAYRHEFGMLTPSRRVDLAWHEFILCTRAYEAFCKKQFGRFIHHTPGGSGRENKQQFEETMRCHELVFGKPDPKFWGVRNDIESSCGACEAI